MGEEYRILEWRGYDGGKKVKWGFGNMINGLFLLFSGWEIVFFFEKIVGGCRWWLNRDGQDEEG